SVKQVVNPHSFDSLKQPVPGGLYDRAFGPTESYEVCITCGLIEKDCPGHPGHMELCVPVYNVFLFDQLYKLLQLKCYNCDALRISKLYKLAFQARSLYIASGHIKEALEVKEI